MSTYAWSPTADQVKALVPARTTGAPFSTTTTPTLADVEALIGQLSEEVLAEVGGIMPAILQADATWVTSLGVAAYVELGFFPEQSENQGVADALYRRYQDALNRLRERVTTSLAVTGGVAPRVGSVQTVSPYRGPVSVAQGANWPEV